MLNRVYIDNFRCLVNFELRLDRLNLLLGDNGTGKTTIFDVLRRIQQFVTGSAKVNSVFTAQDLTRWQSGRRQRFELNLRTEEGVYTYSLVIEHDEDLRRMRIDQERLLMDDKPLFELKIKDRQATAQLYHDDFKAGPKYPFDWTQSGVGSLGERPDNKKLIRFRRELARFIIAAPCPSRMEPETQQEEDTVSWHMENFVSWYRWLSQEHQGSVFAVFQELKDVLPGFTSFSLKETGENARVMKASFDEPGGSSKSIPYTFNELSDGQRMLIVLYTLLFGLGSEGLCLFLDEPDNYVALREIQPWLMALTDRVGKGVEQAVLVSHHPEVIDYLAGSAGRWFERDAGGPAQVSDKPKAQVEGLKPSETVARGWDR